MENIDLTSGTVGKPMTGVEVRLVDWEEGNYRVTDTPYPRGEILLGKPIHCLDIDGNHNIVKYFQVVTTLLRATLQCATLRRISSVKTESNGSGRVTLASLTNMVRIFIGSNSSRISSVSFQICRQVEDHRPQEGPGQAAAWRICFTGKSRSSTQDSPPGREHLRLWRSVQKIHCRFGGSKQTSPGSCRSQVGQDLRVFRAHPGF